MEDAVGAFNSFINAQRDLELLDEVFVTLASFDHEYTVVFDRLPLDEVPELTVSDVRPRGSTSLNDAIGRLVTGSKYPDNDTILLIQTDGYENSSTEFNPSDIKKLIQAKEDLGWDVNFIGAGIDAFSISEGLGFKFDKSYTVSANSCGMADFSNTISASTTLYRNSKL